MNKYVIYALLVTFTATTSNWVRMFMLTSSAMRSTSTNTGGSSWSSRTGTGGGSYGAGYGGGSGGGGGSHK